MQHHEHRMSVFFFFEFFILSDILINKQLVLGQIVYYLKLDSGTGYRTTAKPERWSRKPALWKNAEVVYLNPSAETQELLAAS